MSICITANAGQAEIVTDPKKYNPEFIILAPYAIWKRICLKQLDSTQALDHQAIQADDRQPGNHVQNHALYQGGQ